MNSDTKMNRRRFLWTAGSVMAASMLACGGSLALATAPTPALNYGQEQCGKENQMDNVLVAYASRYGSSAEIAQAIGKELCSRGIAAEVRNVEDVTDLSAYGAVVVGSAIRMGHWLPAATAFVQNNQTTLRSVPTAFFTVHMLATDESAESRQQRTGYTAAEHELVKPELEAFFTGKIDAQQLNLMERLMVKMVQSPTGDLRNWDAVRTWADAVADRAGVTA